jgi:nucleoside 2-deoxyribosyltransferase
MQRWRIKEIRKMKKLVYVAGPYRGNIKTNIENAERKSIELIRRGFDVLTPHKNSAGYEQYEDGSITHKTWLDMGLNLLSRCDVLYVMKNAENSEGTQAEIAFALKHNIVVISEYNGNEPR